MERLIFLRIAADRIHIRAGGEKSGNGVGSSKAGGEVKGGPSVG
jgi:hypothetical protein